MFAGHFQKKITNSILLHLSWMHWFPRCKEVLSFAMKNLDQSSKSISVVFEFCDVIFDTWSNLVVWETSRDLTCNLSKIESSVKLCWFCMLQCCLWWGWSDECTWIFSYWFCVSGGKEKMGSLKPQIISYSISRDKSDKSALSISS